MSRWEWAAWLLLCIVIFALTWTMVSAQDSSVGARLPGNSRAALRSDASRPQVLPVVAVHPEATGSALRLAQACWLEASFSLADCRAIKGVIERRAQRAGVGFETMLMRYTALDANAERSRFARGLPDHAEPTWTPRQNRRWQELRETAASDLPSICDENPDHWGGMSLLADRDRALEMMVAGKWKIVDCGNTKNTFFRVRR